MIKGDKQERAAIVIQKHWRRHVARKVFLKRLKRMRKKIFTVQELVRSQKDYCNDLSFVIEKIMSAAEKLIDDTEMRGFLFGNIEQIYGFHSHFIKRLEQMMSSFSRQKTKLSEVILKELFEVSGFKQAYTKYCFNYKTTDQAIKVITASNRAFTEHLRSLGLTTLNLTLQSYMIKPMQRLCKYGLMVGDYARLLQPDHIDYKNMKQAEKIVDKLVHETNDQVEEFLMRQRLQQLKRVFPTFFGRISSAKKMQLYYETKHVILMDVIRQQEISYKSMALFENSVVLIPKSKEQQPIFLNYLFIREIENSKYYKQMIQLIDCFNYHYIRFKDDKDRKDLLKVVQDKFKPDQQPQIMDYAKVNILGTQTRESFFSSYTVYIATIYDPTGSTTTIYPRFKDLLKVQDLVIEKGLEFDPPLLIKESIIATLKSKTIQKRKLAIQQFLERVLNSGSIGSLAEIEQVLGVQQGGPGPFLKRITSQMQEITILLPNLQKVKVLMGVHESKMKDLKAMISQQMGMDSSDQFEVFQVRNRNFAAKKLLYDDEPVRRIYEQQLDASGSINPFRDTLEYMYTRHYYLKRDQEEELYKFDQARGELQLAVIHLQLMQYRLEEEVMLTFMCLFALYIHLPIQDSDKLSYYLKEINKKGIKLSEQEFKLYYRQVNAMVGPQQNSSQTLPLIIIKVVSNSYLYQCQQFQVEIHHKVYSTLQKYHKALEKECFLALHPQNFYLLAPKDKKVLVQFSYSQLSMQEAHPSAIVFQLQHSQIPLTLKTNQVFEINKLFEAYKKNDQK